MNIYPFQAIISRSELISSEESFFGTVKYEFPQFLKNGFFKSTDKSGLYLYYIETPHGTHRGLVANNDIKDIYRDKILKHERTLEAKKQKLLDVMEQNQAMIKPVLLAYHPISQLEQIFDKVMASGEPTHQVVFKELKEKHSVWLISEEDIVSRIQAIFADKVHKVYIADGHHRMATTLKMHQGDYKDRIQQILSIYLPFNELSIYEYNRVVDIAGLLDEAELMARLCKYCKIDVLKKARKSRHKNEVTMYLRNRWYKLRWKKSVLRKYAKKNFYCDTDLLNHIVLNKIIGIEDITKNTRITYCPGVEGLQSLVDAVQDKPNRVAFSLYPITSDDIKYIADNNLSLPPKSTWFEPRIKNGMIVYPF